MNLLLFVLAALTSAFQALPPRAPSSIEGIVLKLGTTEPLANAVVQLNLEVSDDRLNEVERVPQPDIPPEELFHRKATTDSNGRFSFENVRPGEYRLIATYEGGGYVPAEYGQRSPTGEGIPFEIVSGQKMAGVQLAMSPTGSITGRIYDRDGEPVVKAQVLAMRAIYKNGHRSLTIVQSVVSDDRGDFRLYWLAPGRYFVAAKPDAAEFPMNMGMANSFTSPMMHVAPPARFGTYELGTTPVIHKHKLKNGDIVEEMYVPVYYPNSVDMSAATAIVVTGGATTSGINIATGTGLITPKHIRGRVLDAAGRPVSGASISAMPRASDPYFAIPRTRSESDGTFEVSGVASGSYQIFVNIASEARTMNGYSEADVGDRDVQLAPITMTTGFRISGRLVVEGTVQPGNGGIVSYTGITYVGSLVRNPDVGGIIFGIPEFSPPAADGSFTVDNIPAGNFRVLLHQMPADGYIKSMRMGNADVLNDGLRILSNPGAPLEIVIGVNAGRITGLVGDTRGAALSNRTVVLVPDVRLRQRNDLYRVVSTDIAGRFKMQGIAPGDYKLFAWENAETGAWQDPEFIQAYESAGQRIRISEGSNENVQLTVIP
jgi:protocatechuate 3,4-dioxygenase beta subunit